MRRDENLAENRFQIPNYSQKSFLYDWKEYSKILFNMESNYFHQKMIKRRKRYLMSQLPTQRYNYQQTDISWA